MRRNCVTKRGGGRNDGANIPPCKFCPAKIFLRASCSRQHRRRHKKIILSDPTQHYGGENIRREDGGENNRLSSKTSKAAAAYRGPGTQQRMFGRYHKHYAVADCRCHHWTKWKHSLSKVNCFSCNIPGNSFTLLTFAALM